MPEETFRWVIAGGVAIATVCMMAMAVAAILLYRVVSGVRMRVDGIAADAAPILASMRLLCSENAPTISRIATGLADITANAKDISDIANDQAHRFAEVGRDIADLARVQLARVDAAVDQTVEHLHQVSENVKTAVRKPVREAGAVVAGVKAAVSSLAGGRRPTVDRVTQDEEMFI